jgi:hypothetical protein
MRIDFDNLKQNRGSKLRTPSVKEITEQGYLLSRRIRIPVCFRQVSFVALITQVAAPFAARRISQTV